MGVFQIRNCRHFARQREWWGPGLGWGALKWGPASPSLAGRGSPACLPVCAHPCVCTWACVPRAPGMKGLALAPGPLSAAPPLGRSACGLSSGVPLPSCQRPLSAHIGLSTALSPRQEQVSLGPGGNVGEDPMSSSSPAPCGEGQSPAYCDVPMARPVLHPAPTASASIPSHPHRHMCSPQMVSLCMSVAPCGGPGRGTGVQLGPGRLLSEHLHHGHWVQGASLG